MDIQTLTTQEIMTVDNVILAIEKLEAIDPREEYAYEKAILAYLTIQKLQIGRAHV